MQQGEQRNMQYHRFVIGVLLNKRMFRIASSGGYLVDEILSLTNDNSLFSSDYFTMVGMSNNSEELHVSFADEGKYNSLTVKSDQIIFKKTAHDEHSSVNTNKAYLEFESLWKKIDHVLKLPAARRIGIVAEIRIEEYLFLVKIY